MADPTEAVNAAMEGELRLLDPAGGSSPERLAELLHPDYQEFGTSGRLWDRDSIIAALTARDAPTPRPVTTTRKQGVQLAPRRGASDLRHRIGHAPRSRSSLWRLTGDGWLLYFHQGTPFSDDRSAGDAG